MTLLNKILRAAIGLQPLRIETRDMPAYCLSIDECCFLEEETNVKPWNYDIKHYIQTLEYLPSHVEYMH